MANLEAQPQAAPQVNIVNIDRRALARDTRTQQDLRQADVRWRAATARADAQTRARPPRTPVNQPATPTNPDGQPVQRGVRGWASPRRADRQAADAERRVEHPRVGRRFPAEPLDEAQRRALNAYCAKELEVTALLNMTSRLKDPRYRADYAAYVGYTGPQGRDYLSYRYSRETKALQEQQRELRRLGVDVMERPAATRLGIPPERYGRAMEVPARDQLREFLLTGQWPRENGQDARAEILATAGDATRAVVRGAIIVLDATDDVMPRVGGVGPDAAERRKEEYDRRAREDEKTSVDRAREKQSQGGEFTDPELKELRTEVEGRRSERARIPGGTHDPAEPSAREPQPVYDATFKGQWERKTGEDWVEPKDRIPGVTPKLSAPVKPRATADRPPEVASDNGSNQENKERQERQEPEQKDRGPSYRKDAKSTPGDGNKGKTTPTVQPPSGGGTPNEPTK